MLFAGLSLISAIVSLEADHIESAGKSFAECIGEFALRGDVFRRLQVEHGGRGRHPRPDVTQEIDPQYDVQSENESQIAYDGRDLEADASLNQRYETSRIAETGQDRKSTR